jgi:outer membrane protein
MKKIIAIIILLTAGYGFVSAQQSYTSVNYVISFPTGDLNEYASKTSFRGFMFQYRGGVMNEYLAVGCDLGWNAFYEEKDYDTYTEGTASISGRQWRYSNHYPLLLSADYFIRPGEDFNPYISFGLGTMYTNRKVLFGSFTILQEAWHFAIKPEAGFIYDVHNNTGVKFSAMYHVGFKSKDIETQSYISLNLGMVFLF